MFSRKLDVGDRTKLFDYSLKSRYKELPSFITDQTLDKAARDALVSYMSGTYTMTPSELLRWTLKLRPEGIDNQPNVENLNAFINRVWTGKNKYVVDPKGWYFKSRMPFQKETFHNLDIAKGKQDLLETVKQYRDKEKGC